MVAKWYHGDNHPGQGGQGRLSGEIQLIPTARVVIHEGLTCQKLQGWSWDGEYSKQKE